MSSDMSSVSPEPLSTWRVCALQCHGVLHDQLVLVLLVTQAHSLVGIIWHPFDGYFVILTPIESQKRPCLLKVTNRVVPVIIENKFPRCFNKSDDHYSVIMCSQCAIFPFIKVITNLKPLFLSSLLTKNLVLLPSPTSTAWTSVLQFGGYKNRKQPTAWSKY